MDAGFNLMCCKKCRGLFIFQDMFLNHAKECEGDPNKSPSQFFACEREIFLQSYERLTPKFFGKLECSSVFHTTGHFLSPADSSQQLDQCSTISENTSQSDTSELQNHGPDSRPDSADEYKYYKNDTSPKKSPRRSPNKGVSIKTEIKQEMAEYGSLDYRVELAHPLKAEDDFPVQNHTGKKKEKPVPVKLIPNIVSNKNSDWENVSDGNDNSASGKLFTVLKKTGKPTFECNKCKYKTRKVTLMKKHQKKHASGNQLKCEKCSFTTFENTNFARHMKTHAACEVACNVCGSMQPDKYTLDRHKKLKHEQNTGRKNKNFKKASRLGIMYARVMNEDDSVVFNCKLCDYTSIEETDMEKHVMVHDSVRVSIAQMDDSSQQGSSTSTCTQNSDISDDSEDEDEENSESMDIDNAEGEGEKLLIGEDKLKSAIDSVMERGESEATDINSNCENAEERKAVQDLYEHGKGGDFENQTKPDVGFVIEKVESLSGGQDADIRSLSLELDSTLWDKMDTTDKDTTLPDLDPVGSFLNEGFGDRRTDFSTLGFEDTLKQLQMAVSQPAELPKAAISAENTTNSEASLKIASVFSGGIGFPLEPMNEDDAKSNSSSETITYEVRLNSEMEEQSQTALVTSSSSPPHAVKSSVTDTQDVIAMSGPVALQAGGIRKPFSKTDEDCCIIGSSEPTQANPVNTGESRLCSTFKQDGKEFYQCHLCQFKTAQWPVMRRHLSAHDSGKMLKCHLCDFSTPVQSTLNSHVKKHENPAVKCEICGQDLPDKNAMKKHMQVKHMNQLAPQATATYNPREVASNAGSIQRNVAPKATTDDVIVLSNQADGGQKYQCTFCQFTSDQIDVVRKHILTHESGAVLRCQYCSFTTFLKSSMTMHVKKHFSPDKSNASSATIPSQSQIVPFSPRTPQMPSPQTFRAGMISPRGGAVTRMASPQGVLMRSPRNASPRMTRSPRGISTVMTRSPRSVNTVMTRSPRGGNTVMMRSPRGGNTVMTRSPRGVNTVMTRSPRSINTVMTRSPRSINTVMTRSPRNMNPIMTRSPRNMNPMMTRSPRNMNPNMTRSPRNMNPMMTRSPRNASPRMTRSPRNVNPGMIRSPRITSPGSIRSPRNASPHQNSVNQYMMQTGMRQTTPQTIRTPVRGNQHVQQFNLTQSPPTAANMQLALVPRGRGQVSQRMRGGIALQNPRMQSPRMQSPRMQSPRMQSPGMVHARQALPANQQIAVRRNLQQNFQSIPRNVSSPLPLPAPPGNSTIVIDDEQMDSSKTMNRGAPIDVDVVQSPAGQLWKCKLCTFNTSSKKEIASHVASHNLTPQYKCPHCNHTSLSKSAMETHIKRHSLTPLPCDICGALLSDKYTLQRHKQSHEQTPSTMVAETPDELTEVRNQVTEVRTQVTEVRTQVKQEYVQTQVKREPQNLKQEPQ